MLSNMRLAVQTPNIHTPSPLRFSSAIKMHGKNKKSKWRFIRSSCFAVTRLTIQVRLNGRHQARYISSACDTILRNVKLLYRISSANVKSLEVRFPGFSVLFTTQNPLKPPYPQKTPQGRRCIPVFSFQGACQDPPSIAASRSMQKPPPYSNRRNIPHGRTHGGYFTQKEEL